MSRANQWFVSEEGIAREVITADIQRYLGPDALVRPGTGTGQNQGQRGFWITAYRTLTSQMIQDLKADSLRWNAERQPGQAGRGVSYQDSQTHRARQHWGPTNPYPSTSTEQYSDPRQSASRSSYGSGYPATESSYTTTPTTSAAYASSHLGYAASSTATAPRTTPADPYASYSHSGGYTQTPYQQTQSPSDPYRTSGSSSSAYAAQSTSQAPAGHYLASDGRYYPISQQPSSKQY